MGPGPRGTHAYNFVPQRYIWAYDIMIPHVAILINAAFKFDWQH